MSVDDVWK